jgi:hypothetical protein
VAIQDMAKSQPILLWVIAMYVAAAAIAWPNIYGGMLLAYAGQMAIIPIALLVTLPIAALVVHREAPFAYIRDVAKKSLVRFLAIALVFCAGIAAFTTYKIGIPSLVPFYADPMLADLDALLHGGNPGEFVHALVPPFAAYALGMLYGPIWFVLWFGLIAFIALNESKALRQRYFWSMAMTIGLLGTLAAIVFSSVGPVLYENVYHSDRFTGLMALINDTAVGEYMRFASGYLYETYLHGGGQAGAGISAMPSMHLAVVTLNALMLTGLNRILGAIAWAYLALILLGSVYLGWHYAIDGYFSIIVAGLIWFVVGYLQRRSNLGLAAVPDASVPAPTAARELTSRV